MRQKWRARLTHIPGRSLLLGGCALVARTVGEGDPQGPPRELQAPPRLALQSRCSCFRALFGRLREASALTLVRGGSAAHSDQMPGSLARPALCLATGISEDVSSLTLVRPLFSCVLGCWSGRFVGFIAFQIKGRTLLAGISWTPHPNSQ